MSAATGRALESGAGSSADAVDPRLARHFDRPSRVRIEPRVDPEEILPRRIDGILEGRFEFNGREYRLGEPIDWLTNPDDDVEWHILLHKFYYAVGLAQRWRDRDDEASLACWRRLIDGWMDVTPPGFIAADVTGRRVQNWIYSLYLVLGGDPARAARVLDAAFLDRLVDAIALQVDFLCENLTPKRNHRTLELLAIFLGGILLREHARSAHWRAFALQETVANAAADLLADGVHCELSTDYHHLAVRNWMQVRALAAANAVPVPPALDAALEKALAFSLHVHNPAGIVPSFSDGDPRSYLALLAEGARLYGRADMRFVATAGREGEPPATRFASFDTSGYHVLRSDWQPAAGFDQAQHLVFDCGPLGEGNHGHFDALSFELHAHGRALVVDPGRYTYSEAIDPEDGCNWRVRFRTTAAHNTVCVDDRPQTRYEPKPIKPGTRHAAGSVRHRIAGPAPDTRLVERASGPTIDLLHGRCASHAYAAVHDRAIVFVERRYWIIDDRLTATAAHDYRLRFQLAPQSRDGLRLDTDPAIRLTSPGLDLLQWAGARGRAEVLDSWVSPRYGSRLAAPALQTTLHGVSGRFASVLLPWSCDAGRGAWAAATLACEPVRCDDGRDGEVLRIVFGDGRRDCWFLDPGGRDDAAAADGPDAPAWRLGERRFRGRWLFWQEDADGERAAPVSHAGARLDRADGPVRLRVGACA